MNKTPDKHLRRALFISGVVFLLAAVALAVFNIWESDAAGRTSRRVGEKLRAEIVSVHSPALQRNDRGMFSVTVEGEEYIGIVCIPSLGLELPVCAECSEKRLKSVPCLYSGTVDGNDIVIAGHNYASHFGGIGKLSAGESVVFISADGLRRDYVVDCVEMLSSHQTEEMQQGDWSLTLFTCTSSGVSRIAVRCVRAEGR
ncbi:MAG: sortase [Clostridia bacterium]|nr:sortase [Clostridia bacterium]